MDSGVNDSLAKLLLRQIEGSANPVLWGSEAAPFVGKALDRLIGEGILAERAPARSWGPCRRCDGSCGDRAILRVAGRLVAECPVYSDLTIELSDCEIRSISINVEALASKLAGASGLTVDCEEIAGGVWLLGEIGGEQQIALALNDISLSSPDGLALLGLRLTMTRTTLLVPSTIPARILRRYRDTGCLVVQTAAVLTGERLALDQSKLLPKAAATIRLTVYRTGQIFVLDDRRLTLTDQPARLLVALAETARAHGGFLTQVEVQNAVYSGNRQPDARPLRDIARDLRDQMVAGLANEHAIPVRKLLENKRIEQYRLALGPEEIEIIG
jgi:hypothetical protein